MEKEITGIVIKKTAIHEYDAFVKVLSKEGIVDLYCKGVNKPESKNRNALNLLDVSNFEIFIPKYNQFNHRLKRATLIKQFPYDSNLLNIQTQLLHWFNLIKSENCELLIDWYIELNKYWKTNKDYKIYTFLLFKILQAEGINPYLNGCVECNKTDDIVSFVLYKGGYLCQKHAINQRIMNVGILKSLFYLDKTFELYVSNVSHEDNKIILKLITEYLTELI